MKKMMVLLLSFVCLLIVPATAMGADANSDIKAGSPLLRIAMRGMGPTPGLAMVAPVEIQDLRDLVAREVWVVPEKREWPLDDEGTPIVETRRKTEMWHTLQRGERLARLRTMFRRNTAALQDLNPDLDLQSLEEGQEVLVWRLDAEGISQSRGNPNSSRLIYGEPFPPGEHYIRLYPYRSFGTHYAVSESVRSLDAYYEAFPDAAPLIVGDMSLRTGRTIHPHRSHQGGRDIDITLPRLVEPPNYLRFHHLRRDQLDAEKTLWLLMTFLEGGYIQYIFLDWHHQRTLYRLARDQGAPQEWLDTVFQYPRRGGAGIIRHARGHHRHFHVRFHCQSTDRWCS